MRIGHILTHFAFGFFLLISNLSLSYAQRGSIRGVVHDMNTGRPLGGVNVLLKGTTFGAATSDSGSFAIDNVSIGKYTIVVSRIGYRTHQREIIVREDDVLRLSFSLAAQPIETQEVVVEREMLIGSTDRIFSIPGSAHYIGPEELGKHSYNDINRALREIPGVYIQEEDGYGQRPNIGLRGTGVERSEKITVMEDGVLMAPAPYSAPAAYYFPTVGRMQGIEVRKGSSQIKYGPFTTGGVLNLLSTRIPSGFKGRANLIAGEDNTRSIHAFAGNTYENLGFLVETYQFSVDGFKKLDGGGNTGFDKKDYLAKFRLNTDRDAGIYQELTFKIGQTDETSNETYLGLTDADFEQNPLRRYSGSQKDIMKTEHRQYQLRHFIKLSDNFDVTTTIYRTDFKRNWYKLDRVRAAEDDGGVKIGNLVADPATYAAEYSIITGGSSVNDNALEVKANNRKYYARGLQSIIGFQFGTNSSVHEVEVGFRYHEDEIDRFQWVDQYRMDNGVMKLTGAGIPGTESNRIGRAKVWAAFVQYKFMLSKFTIIPGVRYEDMTLSLDDYGKSDPQRTGGNLKSRVNKVSIFIPGIGLDYQFTPTFNTFLGVHKGFSPPGSKEGTKPEESINYELGARYRNSTLAAQGVIFFNDYSNLLGSDLEASGGEGTEYLFNGGEVDVKGIELSVGYDLGEAAQVPGLAIPLRVSYTYTEAEFKNRFKSDFGPWGTVEPGFELPYLPRHQVATSIGLEWMKYAANLSAKYVGKTRTEAGTGDFIPSLSTDARLVLDLSLDYALTPKNKVFVSVRNLTDEIYIAARRPAGIRPGLPRTLLFGVKSEF